MQKFSLGFTARWSVDYVNAKPGGTSPSGFCFHIKEESFVPVMQITEPYKLDHLPVEDAKKVLFGSSAINRLQAFNGINLDLASMAITGGVFEKRFFLTDDEIMSGEPTTTDVLEGDVLMILVPRKVEVGE